MLDYRTMTRAEELEEYRNKIYDLVERPKIERFQALAETALRAFSQLREEFPSARMEIFSQDEKLDEILETIEIDFYR